MNTDTSSQYTHSLWLAVCFSTLLLSSPTGSAQTLSKESSIDDFLDASLSDLLSMKVTTVSRKQQPLSETAAAVFVITQDDIMHSGVTSIPEALRMAPGVQVARINANQWAVTIRGYNGRFSNKLLVLMDGRSVYNSTFSGVYWDAQDTLLDDIERIEVIRGPGATLWGANAVNGVINIITKHASDTQGGLVTLGAGSEEKGFAGLRYGANISDSADGRFYVKYFDRDSGTLQSNKEPAGDEWDSVRAGFRLDGVATNKNTWTFQGDIYDINEHQIVATLWQPDSTFPASVNDVVDSSGLNLLGRWQRQLSDTSATTLQVYYDHTERDEVFAGQTQDTVDIDFQHQLNFAGSHDLIWGAGYRRIEDDFDNTFAVAFIPAQRTDDIYSAVIQDEIELIADNLRLTLGSKFEHNDYTGFEVQPSIKLLWKANERHTFWGAISRAVRTPSRVEVDGNIAIAVLAPAAPPFLPDPVTIDLEGNPAFNSETLIAYEVGYRVQAQNNLAFDLTLFYNDYERLQSFKLSGITLSFDNKMEGSSVGLEAAIDWKVIDWWTLQTSYSYIDVMAETVSGGSDVESVQVKENSSPEHQLSVRSSMVLGKNWELDLWAYYVDKLSAASASALITGIEVDSYTSLNIRLSWKPVTDLEISLVGQNLLEAEHLEFIGETFTPPTMVDRSVYIKASVTF
ncbi:MAG: TonB-dependent receptor [Gammaproteobacteria bacterium]|nr:TonB-dependent receptor [Gammaproteobacteria bacterium]